MKKITPYLNIVLALAVVVLYVLHFITPREEKPDISTGQETRTYSGETPKIAYVNFDTLLNNYDLYYDLSREFQDKQKTSQATLDSKAKALEKDIADFQRKVQKGLITRSTAREMEQELTAEQEKLMRLREDLTMELAENEQVMQRQMLYEIMEYLEKFNRDKNYQFIINNSFGGTLLYAEDEFNITQEVLKGLNEEHKTKREKK